METQITTIEATQFSAKTTIITLSEVPTKEQMDALFCDESIVLEF